MPAEAPPTALKRTQIRTLFGIDEFGSLIRDCELASAWKSFMRVRSTIVLSFVAATGIVVAVLTAIAWYQTREHFRMARLISPFRVACGQGLLFVLCDLRRPQSTAPRPVKSPARMSIDAEDPLEYHEFRTIMLLYFNDVSETWPSGIANGYHRGVSVPMWIIIVGSGGLGTWCGWQAWRRRRRGSGQCERCGYLLSGLPSGAPCPECGGNSPSAR